MTKRSFSILLALALVGGVLGAAPAKAQAVTVPDTVQIDDPVSDANFLNDQDNAYGTPLAGQHNQVTPADIGSATDLMKVWFTHTASDITLNIQTQAAPGNLAYDIYMRFSSNAGEGSVASDTTRGCLQWVASINGAAGAYSGVNEGVLTDKCNVGTPVVGPLVIAEGPDGTGVTQITFPRSYSPLLADGQKLTAPFGVVRVAYVGGAPSPTTATAATIDSTIRGTDYEITGSGPVVAPEEPKEKKPPVKAKKPGKAKKKGCPKGKGKKKGCPGKPKPPVGACAPYVPGEEGVEAETTVVTDAATEEKPVVVELTAAAGLGNDLGIGVYDRTSSVYQNVQIDTAKSDAGLYVKLEFANMHDYDLYLNHADGSTAANSGDFNPAAGHDLGGGSPDGAWEAGTNYEMVKGIRTADCAGYTARLVSYLTTGGAMTLSLWLGEVVADPNAPDGGEEALSTFYSLLGV